MYNGNRNRIVSELRNIVHYRNISSIRSLLNNILKDLRLSSSVLRLRIENLKTNLFIGNCRADSLLFVDGSTRNGYILYSSRFTKLGLPCNRIIINSPRSRVLNI